MDNLSLKRYKCTIKEAQNWGASLKRREESPEGVPRGGNGMPKTKRQGKGRRGRELVYQWWGAATLAPSALASSGFEIQVSKDVNKRAQGLSSVQLQMPTVGSYDVH
jgi:hypothetical protein